MFLVEAHSGCHENLYFDQFENRTQKNVRQTRGIMSGLRLLLVPQLCHNTYLAPGLIQSYQPAPASQPAQPLELETKVHPKVRNHGEVPTRAICWLKVPTSHSAPECGFYGLKEFLISNKSFLSHRQVSSMCKS